MTNTLPTSTDNPIHLTWAQMREQAERDAMNRAFEEFEERTHAEEHAIRERKRHRPLEED